MPTVTIKDSILNAAMQTQTRKYTPEEYLAIEESAEFRSEYQDGAIIAVTGGSISHNRIVRNLTAFLTFALRGKKFEPFTSDLRLWIPRYRRFTYPDLLVIQGGTLLYDNRTDKFRYYRSLPTLQEYMLVNQYEMQIE